MSGTLCISIAFVVSVEVAFGLERFHSRQSVSLLSDSFFSSCLKPLLSTSGSRTSFVEPWS